MPTQVSSVYLTFDDGPHPEVTGWVLDQLEKFSAKATFFCVGENAVKFPSTVESIIKAGHSVGNHSFNHLNGWKTENQVYFENVSKCAEVIHSDLFRPPYGKIRLSQINELKKKYRIVMWSLLSRDYDPMLNVNESTTTLKKKSRTGSVIVFHDSLKSEKNLRIILPEMLKYWNENNFKMRCL
ncbi:MAG: polysaccharide deacetylase family protein [Bacteroidia bacterium]